MIEGIEFLDLAIFMQKQKTLVIADVHMGYEEALNKQGILIPRHQYPMTISRLEKIFEKVSPEVIVIAGDLKHEFGTISTTEWRHTLRLIDFLSGHSAKLILIKGNHDTILGPIAHKVDITLADVHLAGDVLVLHGDIIPKDADRNDVKTIIIGHEHPAITLLDYPRAETYKCFLVGRWKGKNLIVLPSFNLVTEGTDVLKEGLLSPFLQDGVADFDAYVVGKDVMGFGKIKEIRKQC